MTRRNLTAKFTAIALAIGAASGALAHDAPTGWSYDVSCCSNKDCRHDDEAVRPVKTGWLVRQTGEVIAWGDSRLRNSPDGRYHICMSAADFTSTDARVLCLYVPPMGF